MSDKLAKVNFRRQRGYTYGFRHYARGRTRKSAVFPAEMAYFPCGKAVIGPTAAASVRNAWDG